MRYLIALLLWSVSSVLQAAQPADGWLVAWNDCKTLGAQSKYTGYLWFLEDEPKLQWTNYLVASTHLNFLSRYQKIAHPVVVMRDGTLRQWPNIGANDWGNVSCLRINVLDYWPDRSVWDKLGDPRLEPYFHVTTLVPDYPAGLYTDGTSYPAGPAKKQTALAPWLLQPLGMPADGPASVAAKKMYREAVFGLVEATDYSPCPVVEVTNFVWQSSTSFDRVAGYYDFLGISDQKTFDKLVGFDRKASLGFKSFIADAVADSGVATEPRLIEVYEKLGGRYYRTLDQVNQRGQGNRNPLLTIGPNDLKFDAQEVFASLPNGLWAMGLFDKDGVRQDSAPDGVGYNHFTLSNNGKVDICLACLVCHDRRPGNGGLQPIKPYFRTLFAAPGPIGLADKDVKKLKELEQIYLSKLDFDPDRRRYIEALYECSGLLPNVYAGYLYETYHRYDKAVDYARAALELGVTEAELFKSMGLQVKFWGKIDNINGNWLLAPERRMRIGRNQWVEVYNAAQLSLRGLPTWGEDLRFRYPSRPVK